MLNPDSLNVQSHEEAGERMTKKHLSLPRRMMAAVREFFGGEETRTGVVNMGPAQSSLDDGTVLARCGEADPLGGATTFLENAGIASGDTIAVSGAAGTIGGLAVFCMTSAQRL